MEENEETEELTYALEGELIFVSYKPAKLERGMYFITKLSVGLINPERELFKLEEIPEDEDSFMMLYGAPVKLFILRREDHEIMVNPAEIGWFDNDEDNDDLYPIRLKHLNTIINDCEGFCWVDVNNDESTRLYEGKAIISYELNNEEEE